jgi:hypothetical protein
MPHTIKIFTSCLLVALGMTTMAAGVSARTPDVAAAMPLPAPHKAVYDFNMISVEQGAGISGIRGQMYFEQADACDAWTSEHRFSIEYHYPERSPVTNTNHYVSWEAKDGSRFHFNSDRHEGGMQAEQLRGGASRKPDGSGVAQYSRPGDLSYDLPKEYLLPSAHTEDAIRRAYAGEKFFSTVLFDGTDADGPVEVSTFIGRKLTAAEAGAVKAAGIDKSLLHPDAWRMRMSFYPLKDSVEMMPAYEMDLVLHANGVVSHVIVDYKSFRVEQNLRALEKLPAKPCG